MSFYQHQFLASGRLGHDRRLPSARQALTRPSSASGLRLDLQFALDQSYTARKGSLPTFTRASAATRTTSTGLISSAAVNEARIDYDPTTRVCRGLLIEETRTNLVTWSEDLNNAAWSKPGCTATSNQVSAPDGLVTADLLVETAVKAQHFARHPYVNVTSGTTYTGSVFLKKGTGATAPDWVSVLFFSPGFGTQMVAFNLTTGAFGAISGSLTYRATQYANGFWRVELTATCTVTSSQGCIIVSFTNNTNIAGIPTYDGQTTSNVFVWGTQFEVGSFASSYIPTTSASVIRSADVCSITGTNFTSIYNQTEGTLLFCGIKQALQTSATPSYLGVDDGTIGNCIILSGGSAESANVSSGGVAQASIGGVTQAAARTSFAVAMRYKLDDFAIAVNGGAVSTDTSGSVPTVSQMQLGNRLGANFMGGWIKAIQYYNRIRTDSQLQLLSTP